MAKLNAEELITVFEHYSQHDFDPTGAELDNAIEVLRTLSAEVTRMKAALEKTAILMREMGTLSGQTISTGWVLGMVTAALPAVSGSQVEALDKKGSDNSRQADKVRWEYEQGLDAPEHDPDEKEQEPND